MKLKVNRTDTWAVAIDDRPGGVADKLAALAAAGVNLELIIARQAPERRGSRRPTAFTRCATGFVNP